MQPRALVTARQDQAKRAARFRRQLQAPGRSQPYSLTGMQQHGPDRTVAQGFFRHPQGIVRFGGMGDGKARGVTSRHARLQPDQRTFPLAMTL